MFTFLLVVFVVVSLLLILIVLVQMGRGAELGAAFGGMGQAQMPQTPENFIGKLTTYLAIAFMLLASALAFLGTREKSSSVLDKGLPISAPANSLPASSPKADTSK